MSIPLISASFDSLARCVEATRSLSPEIEHAGYAIVACLRAGGKIMTCGNGGSAADALHMAEELTGRYKAERRPLAGLALCADPTLLTCIGNDYGYDQIFSRQVEGLGKPGDILVTFSSSGNSPTIIKAMEKAKACSIKTIALLGKGGGRCKGMADHELIIPDDETARVQELHTFILHLWLEMVEKEFCP